MAKQVADDGYGEYPDIKQQIVDAADQVADSKNGLLKAVQFLQTARDRKQGWNALVDACKVIAGKTVLLLQIVYGAEVERLFRAAELAVEAMKKLNAADAAQNPQAFADDASNAATQAKQGIFQYSLELFKSSFLMKLVAQYLRDKAEATESPILKEQLEDEAKKLDTMADELIEKANHLLENPEDPAAQKEMNQAIEELKKEIDNANKLLKGF